MRCIISFALSPEVAFQLEKTVDSGNRSRFVEDAVKEKLNYKK